MHKVTALLLLPLTALAADPPLPCGYAWSQMSEQPTDYQSTGTEFIDAYEPGACYMFRAIMDDGDFIDTAITCIDELGLEFTEQVALQMNIGGFNAPPIIIVYKGFKEVSPPTPPQSLMIACVHT